MFYVETIAGISELAAPSFTPTHAVKNGKGYRYYVERDATQSVGRRTRDCGARSRHRRIADGARSHRYGNPESQKIPRLGRNVHLCGSSRRRWGY